jgi:hypothetical protein
LLRRNTTDVIVKQKIKKRSTIHYFDVIQIHGLRVVGTPLGTSEYVRWYVRNKCGTICKDVEAMRICADPLIRYHLLKFCMNTRLSFLSRCQLTQPHPR